VRRFLIAFLAFGSACAGAARSQAEPQQLINVFQIDSTFADFLSELHLVMETERVLCLYGSVSGDTAWLNFIKPAKMRVRTRHLAAYDQCPQPKGLTTIAQYLGTWHPHNIPEWDGCGFSEIDTRSFVQDKRAVMDLLSCKGKLMARSRHE
jgi:hypothetical protein